MDGVAFFAYGSFCEGMVHFQKIHNFIQSSQKAWVKGSVYRLQVGFPVLLEEGQQNIQGNLVILEESALLLRLLDEFHGYNCLHPEKSLFHKTQVEVFLEDGSTAKCYVYYLNPNKLPKSATAIANGDWQQSLRETPVVTCSLTEKQKTYIKKLGQSSGRDIVPIDMQLYRELMSLEIIRDKGRRLALTSFGTEVYRYLD